jgi:thiol-disulfide isomerase/thioredoxin
LLGADKHPEFALGEAMKKRWLALVVVTALAAAIAGCGRAGNSDAAATKSAKSAATALAPAPNVSFQDLDGKTVNLADYRGKVVLVNFWATWCEPCRTEIPELIEFQDKYGPKSYTTLGVAMDQEGRSVVAPFVAKPQFDVNGQKTAMNYPVLIGNDDIAAKFGGIIGLPTSFLVSKDGKVVRRVIGPIDDQTMDKLIQQLL